MRPTIDLVLNSKRHGQIRSVYALWANLGNTERRFAQLLQRLDDLRASARYLRGRRPLSETEANECASLLAEMRAHVGGRVDGTDLPEAFFVYATREINAGTLITRGDFSLKRPSPPSTSAPAGN